MVNVVVNMEPSTDLCVIMTLRNIPIIRFAHYWISKDVLDFMLGTYFSFVYVITINIFFSSLFDTTGYNNAICNILRTANK